MIAESELILNGRGALYHIDMKAEELADIVITVGDPERVDLVCAHFNTIEFEGQHREFRWKTGIYEGARITVISTGIGPDNIDIVLNELDAVANIDLEKREIKNKKKSLKIIRLGTTGGLSESSEVDHLVVSRMAVGIDNLMHYYPYRQNPNEKALQSELDRMVDSKSYPIRPYVCEAAEDLLVNMDPSWEQGVTITAPGFYGPQSRVLRSGLSMPDLLEDLEKIKLPNGLKFSNFEMETSALIGLSNLLGHRATAVSVIVAHRKKKTFSENAQNAVQNMIAKCLPIIAKF